MITSLRREINANLDRPLSDSEWTQIETQFGARVRAGLIDPAGVAEHVKQLRDAFGDTKRTPVPALPTVPKFRADPARQAREDLLSHFITGLAAYFPMVEQFREDVLDGTLLKVTDVETWIQARARAEHYTVILEVPARVDKDKWTMMPVADAEPKLQWLKYILPGEKSRSVPTAAGRSLDRLRLASEYVAAQTGVAEPYATMFILCNSPLPYYSLDQRLLLGSNPALNRIQLTIDATLSPRQVAETYRRLRAQVFGKRRYRAMGEKHIRLALFTMSRGSDDPIKTAMAAWNKAYPKWRYRQESNFGRDRATAQRRAFATLNAAPTSQNAVEKWLFGGKASGQSPSASTTKKSKRRAK